MPIEPAEGQDEQETKEDNFAAYVQAQLQFGKLEVIGGVRYNRTDLSAKNLVFPTYIGPILARERRRLRRRPRVPKRVHPAASPNSAQSEDFLPRVLFNYRESDNLIFRGGYFMSVARPADRPAFRRRPAITFINIPIPGPEGVKPILQVSLGQPEPQAGERPTTST